MFDWFELKSLFNLPNYFWILCAILLVLVVVCVVFGIVLSKKVNKIKTLKAVLHEEKTCKCDENCECCASEEEKHEAEVKQSELAAENETLSKELNVFRGMLEKSHHERDELTAAAEDLKKRIVELEEKVELKETQCADLENKLKEALAALDSFKVKNVECGAEIASYKATNDILSKSIDNLKTQLAESSDEIDGLKQRIVELQSVKKKAEEEAENNKVLMKAVSLIMNTKEDAAESKKAILHEEVKIPVAEKLKKVKKAPVKKVAPAKPVEEDLESLKRPDLMHLAKREGVKRFARKSNQEIIRLVRENRKSK